MNETSDWLTSSKSSLYTSYFLQLFIFIIVSSSLSIFSHHSLGSFLPNLHHGPVPFLSLFVSSPGSTPYGRYAWWRWVKGTEGAWGDTVGKRPVGTDHSWWTSGVSDSERRPSWSAVCPSLSPLVRFPPAARKQTEGNREGVSDKGTDDRRSWWEADERAVRPRYEKGWRETKERGSRLSSRRSSALSNIPLSGTVGCYPSYASSLEFPLWTTNRSLHFIIYLSLQVLFLFHLF